MKLTCLIEVVNDLYSCEFTGACCPCSNPCFLVVLAATAGSLGLPEAGHWEYITSISVWRPLVKTTLCPTGRMNLAKAPTLTPFKLCSFSLSSYSFKGLFSLDMPSNALFFIACTLIIVWLFISPILYSASTWSGCLGVTRAIWPFPLLFFFFLKLLLSLSALLALNFPPFFSCS